MATIDLSKLAVGGATRPDSFSGLDPAFLGSLQAMIGAAPPDIQSQFRVLSGYRSPERQAQLWEGALAKYGSPDVARKWVAPPGRSKHNHGQAVDLRYLGDTARKWAHENAGNYGLHFPLSNEPWHLEPVGSRGGGHSHGGAVSAPAAPSAALTQPTSLTGGAAPAMVEPGEGPLPVAPPMTMGAPVAPDSGLGQVMANLAPAAAEQERRAEVNGPQGVVSAAKGQAAAARGLMGSLTPDVAALMGLGKRPSMMVG